MLVRGGWLERAGAAGRGSSGGSAAEGAAAVAASRADAPRAREFARSDAVVRISAAGQALLQHGDARTAHEALTLWPDLDLAAEEQKARGGVVAFASAWGRGWKDPGVRKRRLASRRGASASGDGAGGGRGRRRKKFRAPRQLAPPPPAALR